jgi:RNA polymerase sigma-70 factor (ECF subfamily)
VGICDPKTFKEIFMAWAEPLQRFIQSKGVDVAISADLSQEAFVRLWNNCSKVPAEKAKSFLFTVGNNLIIDEYRKNQTQLKLKQIVPSNTDTQDGQYQMEMQEFKAKLENAIDTMTPGSKEVFILYRFNEMSYKEIAEQLQISVKAVEKRMSGALKHLAGMEIRLKR